MAYDLERLRALLDEIEEFPHVYTLKFIGLNTERFSNSLSGLRLAFPALPEPTSRESSGGRHLAITYVITVGSSQEILDLYALVAKIEDVVIVL
jgi:putative lipoic acid-binding regulatory protein